MMNSVPFILIAVVFGVVYLIWSARRLWRQSGAAEPMVDFRWTAEPRTEADDVPDAQLLHGPTGLLNPTSPLYVLKRDS